MRHNTAYKFRFYPTAEQKAALAEVFGHTRYVWNWALDLRTQSYYEKGKSLTYTDTSKRLTKLKRDDDHQWLRDVSSVALQQKLRDLEQAFQNFFEGRTGYPNFKRKHGKQSARFASNAFTLYGKALSVAKVPGERSVRWRGGCRGRRVFVGSCRPEDGPVRPQRDRTPCPRRGARLRTWRERRNREPRTRGDPVRVVSDNGLVGDSPRSLRLAGGNRTRGDGEPGPALRGTLLSSLASLPTKADRNGSQAVVRLPVTSRCTAT